MKQFTTLIFTVFLLLPWTISAQGFGFAGGGSTVPDFGCGSNEISFPTNVRGVGRLNYARGKNLGYVYLDITHSYVGDIKVTLTSPKGTSVVLTEFNGGSGNNYTVTNFVSWGANNPITGGSAPFNGNYDPEQSLAAFDGEWADGTWTLTICDRANGDVGTFNSAGLWFSYGSDNSKIVNMDFWSGNGFNNGSGTNSFNITNSDFTADPHGVPNLAYHFDGSNPITLNGDNGFLNPTGGITLAAWVKPDLANNTSIIVGKSDVNYQNLYHIGTTNGEYFAEVKINGSNYTVNGGTVTPNRWDHVALIYQTSGGMILYINGVAVDSRAAFTNPLPSLLNTGRWRIGASGWDPNFWTFEGDIDHVTAWNHGVHTDIIKDHASALNNDCRSAIEIPVNGVSCNTERFGQNFHGLNSGQGGSPICANYGGGDQWFKVTVPQNGNLTVETKQRSGNATFTDAGMEIYSGDCYNLVDIECNDDGGAGNHSKITLSNRTPGEELWIRVWEYGNDSYGFFGVCAYDPQLVAVDEPLSQIGLTTFPNPSDGMVRVVLENTLDPAELTLFSMDGRLLLQRPLVGGEASLDLSAYAAGGYLLKIQSGSQTLTKKLIRK